MEELPLTEEFEDLYDNAPCGYLSIQPNGKIFKANLTIASWLGFARENLEEKNLHDLLDMAGRIFYETHFAPLLRMQSYFNEVALDLVTQDGCRLPVLVNARERRDGTGRHLFTRLTIFNATDRRRYERQLLDARSAAEASKQVTEDLRSAEHAVLLDERDTAALREQFIAVLGHDLRNPLAAMVSGMSLLGRTPLDDRAKSVVALMQNSAARMSELIANLLDFAQGRLGSGLSILRAATTNLEPTLRQVIAELQVSHRGRAIETQFSISEAVDCDTSRISQLVSNLVANALTHGAPDKPIKVVAITDHGKFRLTVSNAGEPISSDAIGRLFEPFVRGDVRQRQQGLGLGLYIVSEIARAHGGSIAATSDQDKTCFTFVMPLHAQDKD